MPSSPKQVVDTSFDVPLTPVGYQRFNVNQATPDLQTQTAYCSCEEWLAKSDSEKDVFQFTYDKQCPGRVISTQDATINTASTTFNCNDEQVVSTYSGKDTFSFTYDQVKSKERALWRRIKRLLES
ncbi:MAG: hypothetical protein HQK59_09270 [Deltaproteobacteria bacterium]|nr:hypothetical protein [Deltaproteobacteria bacterium]